jgi:hypothetical protein
MQADIQAASWDAFEHPCRQREKLRVKQSTWQMSLSRDEPNFVTGNALAASR